MYRNGDSTASSISKSPIVMKIMVDYQHLEKLIEAEKNQEKYFKKLRHDLEHKASSHTTRDQDDSTVSKKTVVEKPKQSTSNANSGSSTSGVLHQTGSGALVSHTSKEELAQTFRNLVRDELSNYLDRRFGVKQEKTETDTLPESGLFDSVPSSLVESKNDSAPIASTSFNETSINPLVTQVDINELLAKVPKAYYEHAQELLKFFLDNPLGVSWDGQGIVTVEGVSIPQSNFFDIFSQLYVSNPKSSLPGFVTVCTYILTSGKQNLIKTKKFETFSRKRKIKSDGVVFPINSKWYYIGDT